MVAFEDEIITDLRLAKEHAEQHNYDLALQYLDCAQSGIQKLADIENGVFHVGDVVLVDDMGECYEAVIRQWNDDETLIVQSEFTGRKYTVHKGDIVRPTLRSGDSDEPSA